jgi:hypothetical protein
MKEDVQYIILFFISISDEYSWLNSRASNEDPTAPIHTITYIIHNIIVCNLLLINNRILATVKVAGE